MCKGPLQDSFDCSVLLRIDNVLAHHHFGSAWLRMHRHVGHVVYLPPSVYGNSQFGQDDVLDDDQLTIAHSRMHGSITLDVHTNSWFAFGSR